MTLTFFDPRVQRRQIWSARWLMKSLVQSHWPTVSPHTRTCDIGANIQSQTLKQKMFLKQFYLLVLSWKYEAVHRFESQSFCMEFECLALCVGEGEGGILMSSCNSKIMQVGDEVGWTLNYTAWMIDVSVWGYANAFCLKHVQLAYPGEGWRNGDYSKKKVLHID